jgi:NADP-dependent 3-hydroxy acid dehydrogenase YdfG
MGMADLSSASTPPTTFVENHAQLDVLVCNAGVTCLSYELTKIGHETS